MPVPPSVASAAERLKLSFVRANYTAPVKSPVEFGKLRILTFMFRKRGNFWCGSHTMVVVETW